MGFVLDASVTIYWIIPDEHGEYAASVRQTLCTKKVPVVPFIWFIECANAFGKARRQKRISEEEADEAISLLRIIEIDVKHISTEEVLSRCINLVNQFDLSLYDSIYLDLAMRLNLPLATTDAKLVTAALGCRGSSIFALTRTPRCA